MKNKQDKENKKDKNAEMNQEQSENQKKEKKSDNVQANNEEKEHNKNVDIDFQNDNNNEDKNDKGNQKDKDDKKKKSKKKDKDQDKDKLIEELTEKNQKLNDKVLRLNAEFDNYKKRTLKEKMELTKSAGSGILSNLLPVIDDFERAKQSVDEAENIEPVKEGINLIYDKFNKFLKNEGVKEIEALGKEFNTDEHEAVTKIPAEKEDLKGKVVDVVQKGYKLNDQILRYSKVVVGE